MIPDIDTFLPELIRNRYPRIDQGVTMDTKKLIRMPGGIHIGTMNVTTIIDNPGDFFPDKDGISMYDVIGKDAP